MKKGLVWLIIIIVVLVIGGISAIPGRKDNDSNYKTRSASVSLSTEETTDSKQDLYSGKTKETTVHIKTISELTISEVLKKTRK